MFELFMTSFHLNVEMKINSWLYFLKRVPLVKLLFKKTGYEHLTLSKAFTVIALIYTLFSKLFTVAFCAGLTCLLPTLLFRSEYGYANVNYVLRFLFLMLYFIFGGLIGTELLTFDKTRYICVKLMRMNARGYSLLHYLPYQLLEMLVELAVFAGIASIIGDSPLIYLVMVIGKHGFALFGEWLTFVYYEHRSKLLSKNYALLIIFGSLTVIATAAAIILNCVPKLSIPIMACISVISAMLGVYSLIKLIKYPLYSAVINETTRLNDVAINDQTTREKQFADVAMSEKSFNSSELTDKSFERLHGFAYLNALFFKRHKRVIYKPMIIETLICFALFIAALAATLLSDDSVTFIEKAIPKLPPILVFVMYTMSTARAATKAMFYNCDISLLRMGIYKKPAYVLASFRGRLIRLVLANLAPSCVLAAGLAILALISGIAFADVLALVLLILVLTLFYAIHSLFLYYMLQPYTTDLQIKSPAFNLINWLTYMLAYLCLQIRSTPSAFLFIVVISTIIYMTAALILVYAKAPKTFRVK